MISPAMEINAKKAEPGLAPIGILND